MRTPTRHPTCLEPTVLRLPEHYPLPGLPLQTDPPPHLLWEVIPCGRGMHSWGRPLLFVLTPIPALAFVFL